MAPEASNAGIKAELRRSFRFILVFLTLFEEKCQSAESGWPCGQFSTTQTVPPNLLDWSLQQINTEPQSSNRLFHPACRNKTPLISNPFEPFALHRIPRQEISLVAVIGEKQNPPGFQ